MTSARQGLNEEQLEAEPLAGATFRVTDLSGNARSFAPDYIATRLLENFRILAERMQLQYVRILRVIYYDSEYSSEIMYEYVVTCVTLSCTMGVWLSGRALA